jgi:hypothetical protein
MIFGGCQHVERGFAAFSVQMAATTKSASYDYLIKLLLIGDSGKFDPEAEENPRNRDEHCPPAFSVAEPAALIMDAENWS